jgi:hypothetical protein
LFRFISKLSVILSNWKNGKKHAQHNKKQGPHSLFLQPDNLPSSSCVSIRIFSLSSQIDIEWSKLCCFMGYSEIASWCGFPPYWRPWGDFVNKKRNKTSRNEMKRNETQQKLNKIKQKRNDTRHNRNETKPKKSSINKKTKQTLRGFGIN